MKKQSIFNRLLSYMMRYKWITLLAFVFVFLTTLVTTALPLLARSYIDLFISTGHAIAGFYLLVIYYALFLLRVLLTFLGQYSFAKVAHSVVRDLRQEAFANIQKLRMAYFDQTPAGAIVSRLTNDTQAVADMFSSIFSSIYFGCNCSHHVYFELATGCLHSHVFAYYAGNNHALSKIVD